MKRILIIAMMTILAAIAVFAAIPDPGHPASQIGLGIFDAGNFTFQNSVVVKQDLISQRSIQFNVSGCDAAGGGWSEGTICWNDQEHTLDVVAGTGQTFQVGQETSLLCVNDETFTINNGQVVYFPSSRGDAVECKLARSDSFDTSDYVAVMTVDCDSGDLCPATFFGFVRDLDTSQWANGTKLYLSATQAGNLTSTVPAMPNNIIWIANVVKSHQNNGFIVVAPSPDPATHYTQKELWVTTNLTVGSNLNASRIIAPTINSTTISTSTLAATSSILMNTNQKIAMNSSDLTKNYITSNSSGCLLLAGATVTLAVC